MDMAGITSYRYRLQVLCSNQAKLIANCTDVYRTVPESDLFPALPEPFKIVPEIMHVACT